EVRDYRAWRKKAFEDVDGRDKPGHDQKEERGKEGGERELLRGGGGLGRRGFGDAVRHRVHLHQRLDAVPLLLEFGELPAGELEPARHGDGHRVDEVVVDQDLEVAMRAGRPAGRADIADDLALLHGDAGRDTFGVARHVAVSRGVAVGVADADIIAVAAFAAHELDGAVARG